METDTKHLKAPPASAAGGVWVHLVPPPRIPQASRPKLITGTQEFPAQRGPPALPTTAASSGPTLHVPREDCDQPCLESKMLSRLSRLLFATSPGYQPRQTRSGLKFFRARAERTEPPWLICPGPAASTLGPHLKFRRQNSRGKQPALSAAARALYSVAPRPRHSTPPRGADNPTKGLMPEPGLQSAFSSR